MWNKSYKWSWSDKMISASEVTVSLHLSLQENRQDPNTVTSKTKQDLKISCKLPTTESNIVQPASWLIESLISADSGQRRLHEFCPR